MKDIEKKLEAVLFFKGEPVSLKKLEEILKVSQSEIKDAVFNLRNELAGRGVALLENGNPARNASGIADARPHDSRQRVGQAGGEISLGTAPEFSKLIENLQKEELNKELSKASLETLSIILYRGGATRAEIDYIRGVNSSFILRALSVRGLINKITDPKDARRFLYQPSFDLLSFMGVRSVEELPEFAEVKTSLESAAQNLAEMSQKAEESSEPPLPN